MRWQGARDKGADLAEDAVDAVRARPVAADGVVAAITLFLARDPLMDLAGKDRRRRRRKRTAQGRARPKTKEYGDSRMTDQTAATPTTLRQQRRRTAAARHRGL